MRRRFFQVLAVVLMMAPSMHAEAPVIQSVVNLVTRDGRFAPGTLATLRYSGTFDVTKGDHVEVAGEIVLAHDDENGDSVTILLNADLAPGDTSVVLYSAAGTSVAYPIHLARYAPAILEPTRSLLDPYDRPFSCAAPATPGESAVLYATGVGPVEFAASVPPPLVVLVGGLPAVVTEAVPAYFPGLGLAFPNDIYRIRFTVPPGEGRRLVIVFFGGEISNVVALPVGHSMFNVSPATFQAGPAAPGSIATAYHCNSDDFTSGVLVAGDPADLPTSLGGLKIIVQDYLGVSRLAKIYAVTKSQVNYVVPPETSGGFASIVAVSETSAIAEGDLQIADVAPVLFAGVQKIDTGGESDPVYLVLYGTGFRNRTSLENVKAILAGVEVAVEYAGPQGQPGLDQLNLRIPRSLAGHATQSLQLTVDGKQVSLSLSIP